MNLIKNELILNFPIPISIIFGQTPSLNFDPSVEFENEAQF